MIHCDSHYHRQRSVINDKYFKSVQNTNQNFVALFFAKMLARKIAPKFVSLLKHFLSKIKKMGWKVFEQSSIPVFFICLYFIGVGGDKI